MFLVSVGVYAQSIKLYETEDYKKGREIADGDTLTDTCEDQRDSDGNLIASGETAAILENTSDEDKMVVCEREIVRMAADAETYFCWGNCYGPENSVIEYPLEAKTETGPLGFTTHYTASSKVDTAIVRYLFYSKSYETDLNGDSIVVYGDSISLVYQYITPENLRCFCVYLVPLSVFPNPAADYLIVEMEDLQLIQAEITLYDVVGRVVKTQSATSYSTKMDVNGLEQGTYFLHIASGNKTIGVRKFVKE